MFERHQVAVIAQRMRETNNPLMQFIIGPRQTGKSTMFVQALHHVDMPCHVVNADDVVNPDASWLQIEWQQETSPLEVRPRPFSLLMRFKRCRVGPRSSRDCTTGIAGRGRRSRSC